MIELAKRLVQSFGPAGKEEAVARLIAEEIKDYVQELRIDKLGNLIAYKKGKGEGGKLMLTAHMDQVGLMLTHIDKHGFLRFTNIGHLPPHQLLAQRFISEQGVIGVVAGEKLEKKEELDLAKLYLDIGASSQEEAQEKVKIGDCFVYHSPLEVLGKRLISRCLDDRIGCLVLIEVLKKIKESKNDLYFVFTVQEEVGLRGAQTAAYQINPDLALAVDVTACGDTPKAPTLDVSLGKGVAIKIKDQGIITHPVIKNLLVQIAEREGIKYQYEVLERGSTDVGPIHLSRGGVPAGCLSIPTRYLHSSAEMVDLEDIQASIELLQKVLEADLLAYF